MHDLRQLHYTLVMHFSSSLHFAPTSHMLNDSIFETTGQKADAMSITILFHCHRQESRWL